MERDKLLNYILRATEVLIPKMGHARIGTWGGATTSTKPALSAVINAIIFQNTYFRGSP